MKQITFYARVATPPQAGALGVLITTTREGQEPDRWDYRLITEPDAVESGGIGGNLDKDTRRYFGWRGTSDGRAVYAHGVYKVKTAEYREYKPDHEWDAPLTDTDTGEYIDGYYAVTVTGPLPGYKDPD